MISERKEKKGILAKLLEQAIKIILNKECKKIGKLKIDIVSSSIQIFKGIIQKVIIIAEDINYKDIFFNTIELEARDVKIIFTVKNKELKLKNNLKVNFKLSFSENSLKQILFSTNWDWIGSIISKEIFKRERLEDITIENNQIFIKSSKNFHTSNQAEKFDLIADRGKIFLKSKTYKTYIKIPIEDKIFIKNVSVENNLIIIFANSPISF